jgi:hypothetical protein
LLKTDHTNNIFPFSYYFRETTLIVENNFNFLSILRDTNVYESATWLIDGIINDNILCMPTSILVCTLKQFQGGTKQKYFSYFNCMHRLMIMFNKHNNSISRYWHIKTHQWVFLCKKAWLIQYVSVSKYFMP